MLKRFVGLVAVLALVAAACGGGTAETTTTTAPDDTQVVTTTTQAPVGQGDEGTLAAVQARGTLKCGVSGSAVAFSETQPDGSVTGFDADFCRAVAAAVLGDANAVEFRALTAQERFDALKSGEVDVLFRNTTWTQSRDSFGAPAGVGIDFGPTTYYDGQQLMGRSAQFTAESTLADIDGAILCTNAGTTTEKNITEGAAQAGATIGLELVETFPEAMEKFIAGTCDLVTTDGSGLVGNKAAAERDGTVAEGDWVIFPPSPISKEPLGPGMRQNDSQWRDIIVWTVFSMIIADEKGITSDNIDTVEWDPEAGRLFGGEGELQTSQGLAADAYYQVIKQVGNYDQVYSTNLNPVGLVREGSLNASFAEGGLIYAPPAR